VYENNEHQENWTKWGVRPTHFQIGTIIRIAVATFTPSRKNSWSAIFTSMI